MPPHAIRSAGMLVIGDEVLNGKIRDTNSYEFARFCFEKLKVPVKRMIVCGDDQNDIVRSLKDLEDCSIVFTSGGIGSTHDDITYESIASAYGLPMSLDDETVAHMKRLRGSEIDRLDSSSLAAYYRMATFPKGQQILKTFILLDLWVPVVGVNNKVYILPGVPQLFTKLMNGMLPVLKPRVNVPMDHNRRFVKTTVSEHKFAVFLGNLQKDCDEKLGKNTVKLGSYPHLPWKVSTISIILSLEQTELDSIVVKIVHEVNGEEIDEKEEEKLTETLPEA